MSGNEDSLGGPPTSSSSSPYHSISVSVPQPSSRSSSSNLLALASNPTLPRDIMAGPGPVCTNDLEVLIRKLQDQNERDDTKLKVLQELWDSFDNFTSLPQYSSLMESLVRCFLKLFSETSAQFIAENNTQQLRKLMLEIILRTTGHEVMRHFSKQIQQHMMKIVQSDNEVNAGLAVKILIDHLKLSRTPPTPEAQVTNLMTHLRKCFNDMQSHAQSGRMFEQRPMNTSRSSGMGGEDLVIETSLQMCFMQHQLNLDTKNSGATNLMFQLIPRASQSVKVLGEVVHLIVLIYQQYKQAVTQDILEMTNTFLVFCNVRACPDQTPTDARNLELFAEFHTSQVKALGFFSFLLRIVGSMRNPITDCLISNGDRIVSATLLLLETCPTLMISPRKDLLNISKIFFQCEALRGKFLPYIPRLFSEKLMIGTAFTAHDCLRKMMYEQLADLLHHLRGQLSYPTLCHATYIYSRCIHDPLLPAHLQGISIRLIMNLCDSFTACENKNNEPVRDIFFGILETIISKLRVIVLYHLPLLFQACGDSAVFRSTEFPASELHPDEKHKLTEVIAHERRHSNLTNPVVDLDESSLHCNVEGVPELEPRPSVSVPDLPTATLKTPDKGYTTVESMLLATWTAAGTPMPLQECKSQVKYLIQASKYILTSLQVTKKTDRALTPAEERDTCARLLKYGLQAIDVFMIGHTPSGGMQLRNNQRDDKEVIEAFASVFVLMNPDVFNEIFQNYTPFLIERIAFNPNLQILCNQFLVNPETGSRFGSILCKYLLNRMPDMANPTERASLYLKLFKLIFSAISCTQQSASATASQNIEKMIKPWLHQIVRDAMSYALRGREPTTYFLLLRALFRSIGGGSQDVQSVYQEFLPLLPSLLSFLNRMQAGQLKVTMRELFVELCLTVPVRLSSLLPHLPLLMDPLVCSLAAQNSVTQSTTTRGLRTLELCVDNLQPEYLHEHIAPVRASLIQGLWRVVSKSTDTPSAMLALKILGKFGSMNRKILAEPQPLISLTEEELATVQCLPIIFDRPPRLQLPGAMQPPVADAADPMQQTAAAAVEKTDVKMEVDEDKPPTTSSSSADSTSNEPIESEQSREKEMMNGDGMEVPMEDVPTGPIVGELCLSEAVKTALDGLRNSSATDERLLSQPTPNAPNFEPMRRYAASLCRSVLLAAIDERANNVEEGLERVRRKIESINVDTLRRASLYRTTNEAARQMYVNALTGIAVAVCNKDLRQRYVTLFSFLVRHLVTQALLEQLDPPADSSSCMDGLIVVDVIVNTLSDQTRHDFVHASVVMLRLLCDTCFLAVGNIETFCALPLLGYTMQKLADLCYVPTAVARLGGATALLYVIEEFPRVLLRRHLEVIVRALTEILVGLAYEVSSGAIETATATIERLMVVLFAGRPPRVGAKTMSDATTQALISASHIRTFLPCNDDEDVMEESERKRILSLLVEIFVPLSASADTYIQKTATKFMDKLSALSHVSVVKLTANGEFSRVCGQGLSDFPGLSLWKQLGVMNAVGYAMRKGVRFEMPQGIDEMRVLNVYVEQLTRLCREDKEKLLSRKTYMLVGASSPTIPHAISATVIREAAIRALCLTFALLPHQPEVEGLKDERVLKTVVDGLKERDKGQRDATEEAVMEAHKLRPFSDEVIKTEIGALLDEVEKNKELTDVNARILCCLIRLNGMLFDERCFTALMTILRGWDERTRRSSAELKERTTADVAAMESVLIMLPHIPKKPRRKPLPAKMTASEMAVIESVIVKESERKEKERTEKEREDEKMESDEKEMKKEEVYEEGVKMDPSIRAILESRPDPSDFVPVVASLASTMHAAFCISRSTLFSSGALVAFLSANPIRTLRFFLSSDSLAVPARRCLFKRVFEAEGAHALRRAAAQSPFLMTNMLKLQYLIPSSTNGMWLDSDFNRPLSTYDEKTMDHELLTIWMIDVWSRNDTATFCKESVALVRTMQEIWRSDDFKTRYMVVKDETKAAALTENPQPIRIKFLTTPKYEVPKLYASCFVRYLRENYSNLELFTDLLFVFVGCFATDFSFVRNYLVQEVIPTYPLWWRRDFFSFILSKFEKERDQTVANLHIARVMQYALTPSVQYAFERFNVEEIVGPRGEREEPDPRTGLPNLVIRLSEIIHTSNKQFGDMTILAMYHLSSLMVIHAPSYIHVNNRTPHSNRLRVFMLFAWPCLNSSSMDITLKFMGHLFLCHIIEKFTINRKIVLQVYHSLTGASMQDSRDIVKKALDILTPQLPIRMDDGLSELVKAVRKALADDSHNVSSVYHCLQTLARNYKTYFTVRHELLPLLLNGIQRLTSYQGSTGYADGKRVAVEVCEVIMKWDLMRKQRIEDPQGKEKIDIEKWMEQLKKSEIPPRPSGVLAELGGNQMKSVVPGGDYGSSPMKAASGTTVEREESGEQRAAASSSSTTTASGYSAFSETTMDSKAAAAAKEEEELRPLNRDLMDQVVNILFRIATTPSIPNAPSAHTAASSDMSRRAIGLLRAALRPALWGDIACIKIAWLEKQITITQEQINTLQNAYLPTSSSASHMQRSEHQQITAHFFQASLTLEVLQQLMMVMPRHLAVSTIRPLQKAIISCLNVSSVMLSRAATALITRLLDNSTSSELNEYEMLSQFVNKYINEQFIQYEKSNTTSISIVFTAFNLLRSVTSYQPSFLDSMCLQNILKVMHKACREYTTVMGDASREKIIVAITDTSIAAIELIRPRVAMLSHDHRRQLAGSIILPLVETNSEKLLECIIRLTRELIVSHNDELTANPGLSIVVKMSHVIRQRFRMKTPQHVELARMYMLQLVLYIFDHDVLRRTEYAAKLEEVFYWGITNNILMTDEATRNAFLTSFERNIPSTLPDRLLYMFSKQDWGNMRETSWVKHALFLLVRCAFPSDPNKARSQLDMRSTATFGATIEQVVREEKREGGGEKSSDDAMETDEGQRTSTTSRISDLLAERRLLLQEARQEGIQKDVLNHMMGLIWAVQDPALVRTVFTRLFTSIWSNFHPQERQRLQSVIPSFLTSHIHMVQTTQPVSAIAVIMETLSKCDPPLEFAPALVKFVASKHRTFYLGLLTLEEEAQQCEVLMGRLKEVEGPELTTRYARQLDALESLNALYADMNETDQQSAVWARRATVPQTVEIVDQMGLGNYGIALQMLEDLHEEHYERLERARRMAAGEISSEVKMEVEEELPNMAVPVGQYETDAWARMHIECLQAFGKWTEVEEMANIQGQADAKILIRAASHRSEPFLIMRQCKEQLLSTMPPDFHLQYQQYSALIAVMDGMGDNAHECRQQAERANEDAFSCGVNKWRLLPAAVGVSHLKLLQTAHLVQDLNEAAGVTCSIHSSQPPFSTTLITELKSVIKTWRTWSHNNGAFFAQGGTYNSYRSPSLHDDMPVTADFFNIRKRVFVKLSRAFDEWVGKGQHAQMAAQVGVGHVPLPAHSLIHTQVLVSRAYRSARLYEQAEHALNLVHGESSLPVASVVAKIIEHIKLLRAWAADIDTPEPQRQAILRRALQVTDDVQMADICREFFSRIYAQRGLVLGAMNDPASAQKTFEISAGLQESLNHCHAYAAWAKHLDILFHQKRAEKKFDEAGVLGIQAIMCYVECAKVEFDLKARRYIARAIWLTRLIAEVSTTAAESLPTKLERAARICVSNYWIEWLPQLCLDVQKGIGCLAGFIAAAARVHPMHVYYALRQHMSVKSERVALVEKAAHNPLTNCTLQEELDKGDVPQKFFIFPSITELCTLTAERRPSDILALERMINAIEEMRDVWAERQLKSVLQLQKEVFQCLNAGLDAGVSHRSISEIVRKWREGLEKERVNGWSRQLYVREVDIRRSLDERLNEEQGEKEEVQFISSLAANFLHHLSNPTISTMELADVTVEWRKVLERRISMLPKSIPIRLSSPFLSSFCAQTATIDLPGDMYTLKNLQYMSTISRFGPYYEIDVKGDDCVKNIRVRAHSGKSTVYWLRKAARPLFSSSSSSKKIAISNRLPQLLRGLESLMQNDRGVCSRFLKIIPPIVVHFGTVEMIEHSVKPECAFYLDEFLSSHMQSQLGMRPDELIVQCEKELRVTVGPERSRAQAQLNVYRTVTTRIPDDILMNAIKSRVPDATYYYLMRKSLVCEWAVQSALEYSLHLTPINPSSILMEFSTGRSCNPNQRLDLSGEERPVPFRLSANMDKYMGFTREGHFAWSLQATLGMMYRGKTAMYLRPIIWDCVSEEDMKRHISEVNSETERIIESIQKRVKDSNSSMRSESGPFVLVNRAKDTANLSRMPSYLHPWY